MEMQKNIKLNKYQTSYERFNYFLISLGLILLPFDDFQLIHFGGISTSFSLYPLFFGLGIWMIRLILFHGRVLLPKEKSFYFLGAFYLAAILSYVANIQDIFINVFKGQYATDRLIMQIASLTLTLLVPLYVYNTLKIPTEKIINWFFKCLLISFLLAGTYSSFEIGAFFGSGIAENIRTILDTIIHANTEDGYGLRLRSVCSEASSFGEYCAVLFPWLIGAIITKRKKWFYLALFVYLILLNVLSLSRTAYAVFAIQTVVCIFVYRKYYKQIITFAILASIAVIFFMIQGGSVFDNINVIDILSTIVFFEGTTQEMSNLTRLGSQVAALNIFMDYPILGVGYGMYGFYAPDYYPNWAFLSAEILPRASNIPGSPFPPVHSLIARLLAETGAIGIFFWLGFIISVLWAAYRLYRYKRYEYKGIEHINIFISLLGVGIASLKSDSMYSPFLWICVGVLWLYNRRKEEHSA
ncbi:O-antigen ligase family protein [Mitsuokella multacida]